MGRRPNTDFYKRLSVPLSKELYVFVAMVARASGSTLAATTARIIELYKDAHPEMLEQARAFSDFIGTNFAAHPVPDYEAEFFGDGEPIPETPADLDTTAADAGADPDTLPAPDAPETPAETALDGETVTDGAADPGADPAGTPADPDGIAD